MVVGTLVGTAWEMGGEVLMQSAVAVGTISNALYIGTFGPPDKPPRKPSPREPSPRKPSPRVASPSATLGGGAHAVAASPREQEEQVYVEEPPQYAESPASVFSLPQQHAQPRARRIAGIAPGGFDTKMEGQKGVTPPPVGEEATFPGSFQTQAMQEQDEPYHLHHPSLHLPTNEGEEGMAAEPGPKSGRPRSGPLSRRSASSSSGHVKQVKCSVM